MAIMTLFDPLSNGHLQSHVVLMLTQRNLGSMPGVKTSRIKWLYLGRPRQAVEKAIMGAKSPKLGKTGLNIRPFLTQKPS
jgi:hypothetical protein